MPKVQIEMEMPKNCFNCPFQLRSLISELCIINNEIINDCFTKRHERCPLREVK